MRRSEFQGQKGALRGKDCQGRAVPGDGEEGWVITRTAVEAVAVTCERAVSGYA